MIPKTKTWRITGTVNVHVFIDKTYTEQVWDKSDEMTTEKAAMLMEDWVHEVLRDGDYEPDIDESDIEFKLVRKAKKGAKS